MPSRLAPFQYSCSLGPGTLDITVLNAGYFAASPSTDVIIAGSWVSCMKTAASLADKPCNISLPAFIDR